MNGSSKPYSYEPDSNETNVSSHFITVTGYIEDNIAEKKMLKISSWGREYYIDYDEYIAYVENYSNFKLSNVVYIQGK